MLEIKIEEEMKIGETLLEKGSTIKVLPKLSESIEENLKKVLREMYSEQVDSLGRKDVHYDVGSSFGWFAADLYGSLFGSRAVEDFVSGAISGLEEE